VPERLAAQDGYLQTFNGDAAMMEDSIFIQRDISHYGAMLKLYMDDKSRANLERLLAEAKQKLALVTASEVQQR
jgi:hypothetical protein